MTKVLSAKTMRGGAFCCLVSDLPAMLNRCTLDMNINTYFITDLNMRKYHTSAVT